MTKENKQIEAPLCEQLIALAVSNGIKNEMKLPELVGHMSIAYMELFTRQMAGARAVRSSEQPEGGDTPKKMDASPDVVEDKA